jgi:hypothetical protein
MKMRYLFIAVCMAFVLPVQAQNTMLVDEDFESGDGDWVDFDRSPVSHHTSGGHDGGAYISIDRSIATNTNNFGSALIYFRCAIAPNQLPTQNCAGGSFVGDWTANGATQLRYWFRHNSVQALQAYIRVPVPNNTPGASAFISPLVPPNTWTLMVLEIDPSNPEWESQFGGSDYNTILSNVGRLQPGIYFPFGEVYNEANRTFDIDDVRLIGTLRAASIETDLPAGAKKNKLHPHHDGSPSAIAGLDDLIPVIILGSSISAGDPINLNTDNINPSTLRLGPLEGPIDPASTPQFNIDHDGDGIDDARFEFLTSTTGFGCAASNDVTVEGEMTNGNVFTGTEAVVTDCDATCHAD